MADLLISLGVAVLLGIAVVVYRRRGGGPAERRRAKAIAETVGRHEPLPEQEQEHADKMRALATEHRTGEQRIVRKQQHLSSLAAVARRYRRPAKHGVRKPPQPSRSKRFDPLSSPMPVTEQAVMLPFRQPKVWELREFTEEWNAADVQRIVAKAKAAGR